MNVSLEQPRFTEGEAEELADYRPLNRLAVASGLLGIASGMALLHPFFICLSAFGVATGLLATRQLALPDVAQTGEKLARWGIFLSLLFGFGVGTKELTRQRATAEQARACAERWFELLRAGKKLEAHQLALYAESRAAAGTPLEQHYAPRERPRKKPDADDASPAEMSSLMEPSPREQLTQFFAADPAKRLANLGPNAKYTYLRTIDQERSGSTQLMVKQDFGVEAVEGGTTKRFVVTVTLERTLTGRIAAWRFFGVTNPPAG